MVAGESQPLLSGDGKGEVKEDKYPGLDDSFKELLCMIDDIIEDAVPSVNLPRLPVESFKESGPTDLKGLLDSLKVPTMTLVLIVGASVAFIAMNNPLVDMLFPYIETILLFLSSVPQHKKRFNETFSLLLDKIESTSSNVIGAVDGVADKGLASVEKVNDGVYKVIQPIKPKLDKATKVEKMLQKIDPSIDIPDTSDIEEELSDARDKVTDAINGVKKVLDLAKYIPKACQTIDLFDEYIVYPVLGVFLVVQLVQVYLKTHSGDTTDEAVLVDSARYLRGTAVDVVTPIVANFTNETALPCNNTFLDELESQGEVIQIAVHQWWSVVVQMLLTFLTTQKLLLYRAINKKISSVEEDLTDLLDEKVKEPFHDVFVVTMNRVKEKLLDLAKKMNKIDSVMDKIPSAGIPKMPSKPPSVRKFF